MVALFGALLFSGSIFYIVYSMMKSVETSSAEDRLNVQWGSDEKAFRPPFYMQVTKPLLKDGPLQTAAGFWSPKALDRWKKKLISAGLGKHIQAEHFVASKFWFTLFIALIMILIQVFAEEAPAPWVSVGIVFLAFYIPNLDLGSRITKRKSDIRIAMPYVVDLLALSTEAGLDFMGSISKVVDRAPPSALIEELSIVLKDIQLGKTRGEGLRAFADRVDMMEISSFVAVLISSDQMGASIGVALRGQSESMRSERLVRAEKMGAQASQKMLVPLVVFIFPAVLLIVLGSTLLGMFMGSK